MFWKNKIGILGAKNGYSGPKIYIFEDFDDLYCNFLYIFAGMEHNILGTFR